ncbi:MAG: hypothetical protein KKB50_10650 [Planctomycetes bacterium]|nr:hypothetical protein [Planctomycetota bacterium]
MSAEVAVYVQSRYAKPAYAVESYNVRAWPGLEMICHALRQAAVEVDYCSSATVGRYKVVLVSITSGCDWYPFVMERLRWPGHVRPTVIAGGAGLLNVRPFLRWCDVFCLGRAEEYVVPLVRAALAGEKLEHPSVVYAADFNVNNTYFIDAGTTLFPHAVPLANRKTWRETAYGCQRKCLFCAYTWHRRHVGGLQNEAGAGDVLWGGSAEKTIFELDLARPETWGLPKLRIVGLDGFSERLRRMVGKPITRDMLRGFFRGLAAAQVAPNHMKVYNIVGYPTETEADWFEFLEDLAAADEGWTKIDPQWGIEVHSTPFRPMPATPCACWPMSYANYRGRITRVLSQGKHREYKGIFYRGNRFWAAESRGTESLPTVILDALVLRGVEDDSETVARLAGSSKFRNASMAHKTAILERHVDVARLFAGYTWETLPTRYLASYIPNEKLRTIDVVARKRAGATWPADARAVVAEGRTE